MKCQKFLRIALKMAEKFLPLKSAKISMFMVANLKAAVRLFTEKLKRRNPIRKNNFMGKIQMIKMEGKFCPAEQDENGKWIPIENAELRYNADGKLEVVKKDKKDETDCS